MQWVKSQDIFAGGVGIDQHAYAGVRLVRCRYADNPAKPVNVRRAFIDQPIAGAIVSSRSNDATRPGNLTTYVVFIDLPY